MVERFIRSYKKAPEALILDFDATERVGGLGPFGKAIAKSVVKGEDHLPGRQRVLPMADAAVTRDRARRVIVKAEHTERGSNPRYVITNLSDDPPETLRRGLLRTR